MFLSDVNWVLGKFKNLNFLEEKEMKGNEGREEEEKGQEWEITDKNRN